MCWQSCYPGLESACRARESVTQGINIEKTGLARRQRHGGHAMPRAGEGLQIAAWPVWIQGACRGLLHTARARCPLTNYSAASCLVTSVPSPAALARHVLAGQCVVSFCKTLSCCMRSPTKSMLGVDCTAIPEASSWRVRPSRLPAFPALITARSGHAGYLQEWPMRVQTGLSWRVL